MASQAPFSSGNLADLRALAYPSLLYGAPGTAEKPLQLLNAVYALGYEVWVVQKGTWHPAHIVEKSSAAHPEDPDLIVPIWKVHYLGYNAKFDEWVMGDSLMINSEKNEAKALAENSFLTNRRLGRIGSTSPKPAGTKKVPKTAPKTSALLLTKAKSAGKKNAAKTSALPYEIPHQPKPVSAAKITKTSEEARRKLTEVSGLASTHTPVHLAKPSKPLDISTYRPTLLPTLAVPKNARVTTEKTDGVRLTPLSAVEALVKVAPFASSVNVAAASSAAWNGASGTGHHGAGTSKLPRFVPPRPANMLPGIVKNLQDACARIRMAKQDLLLIGEGNL